MNWNAYRNEFPFAQGDAVFLNTGSSGLKPAEVLDAAAGYARIVTHRGPCGPAFDEAIKPLVEEARTRAGACVNAAAGGTALCINTSQALSAAAQALRWRAGDKVLVARSEYISGHLACQLLAERFGVEIVPLDHAPDHTFDMERFAQALAAPGVRLALVSHVHYHTGEILPMAEIARLCRERGVVSLVDGAQAVGQIPVDFAALGCDMYVYPAHKWLCGIEGAGALVVRRDLLPTLLPLAIGYDSVARFRPDEPLTLHPDARRFEYASPPYPALFAFSAALARAERIGIAATGERIRALARRFWEGAARIARLRPVTPPAARGATGLASFILDGTGADQVVSELQARGFILRTIPHPSCVRASFHAYNTEDEVDRLLAALAEIRA